MTDQPEAQEPDAANSVTNVSGGVNANAERIDIGGDVVARLSGQRPNTESLETN